MTKRFLFFIIGLKNIGKGELGKKYFYDKRADFNTDRYIAWVIKILKKASSLPEGYRYNSTSLYMNEKNVEKLHNYLYPMVWLNYSPTIDNSLKNWQYRLDENKIVVKEGSE